MLTLQIINSDNTIVPLTINLDVLYTSVIGTILVRRIYTLLLTAAHGVQTDPIVNGFKLRTNQRTVITIAPALPSNSTAASAGTYNRNVPAFSIEVLQMNL